MCKATKIYNSILGEMIHYIQTCRQNARLSEFHKENLKAPLKEYDCGTGYEFSGHRQAP